MHRARKEGTLSAAGTSKVRTDVKSSRQACRSLLGTCTLVLGMSTPFVAAHAATLQVHGQLGLVGDYINSLPPNASIYQGWRVPLGITLEARPVNTLALYLDVRMGYNHYPTLARELGNTQDETDQQKKAPPAQPFTTVGGRGEKAETLHANYGYVEYASPDFGLFKVGRFPRHWGLGIWRHDGGTGPVPRGIWTPEGGTVSVTDGIAATVDFKDTLIFSAYWEKNSEGSPFSRSDDAEAWTAELVFTDNPTEITTSGSQKEVGIAYSRYNHNQSSTRLNILDLYARYNHGSLLTEGEVLYPSGSTESAGYSELGAGSVCSSDAKKASEQLLCDSEKVDMFAALVKLRYQISSSAGQAATIATTDIINKMNEPTSRRRESHIAGVWLGYASGDSEAFQAGEANVSSDKVDQGVMHPNIRPALLMFSTVSGPVAGMPTAIVQNSLFVRGEYTFESPSFGALTPAVIWANLRNTNHADTGPGRYKDLGYEADIAYSYTTNESIRMGVEAGVWLPGKAWATQGSSKPTEVYGGRATISTAFY